MYLEIYAAVNGTFELVISIGDEFVNTLVDDEIRQYPVKSTRVVRWPVRDEEVKCEAAEDE